MERTDADILVIGAGAAGLFAAIWAARTAPGARVVALDGATRLGAKILVAGGGRCNVTHDRVHEHDYHGSTPHAIRKVLARFDVPRVVEFFRERGVELKREETGKLFPVSDDARTILDALLRAAHDAGVRIIHPWRVQTVTHTDGVFTAERTPSESQTDQGPHLFRSRRLILATGGKSLPKTGSDGLGYQFARSLGHTLTPSIVPALVPLKLEQGHWLCALSGVSAPVRITLRGASRTLAQSEGPLLLTHFGLSGPAALDISRSWILAHQEAPESTELSINFLPARTSQDIDTLLKDTGRGPHRITLQSFISSMLPERLARALLAHARVDAAANPSRLDADARRRLSLSLTDLRLRVIADRGWLFAEATAGGIPLSEVRLDTMESRVCTRLHLCGEMLDVDGRLGGFNFQWAWASGYVAGCGAANRLVDREDA